MLTPISKVLEKTARKFGSEKFRLAQIRELWAEVVGEAFAQQVEPARVRDEVLFLTSSAPIWSTEVMLRQRVILERLNARLPGAPVKKLYCHVGQLAHTCLPRAPREQVDWEAVQVDREILERIERTAAQIQDPDLAESVRRVMLQLERRKVLAFQRGWLPCTLCGQPGPHTLCGPCRQEARRQRRGRILRRLGNSPWLTRADLLQEFQDLSADEYLSYKQRLRSLWLQQIWAGIRAQVAGKPLPESLRSLMVDLCMLRTSLPSHRLKEAHVRFALGKTLGRAYLEDRVPELPAPGAPRDPRPEK